MAKATVMTQFCDTVASYMDGVHVKIAEAYKPPRKVTLPAAYNNKLPNVSKHTYDFGLEKTVLDKLREWRTVRESNSEARRIRLEERKKRNGVRTEKTRKVRNVEELNENEDSGKRDSEKKNSGAENNITSCTNDGNEEPSEIPIKIAPAPKDTILTPQRLSPPVTDLRDNVSLRNGGLDYADFDNDTSSPFDNMELKTINDMEELAQVYQVLQTTSRWIAPNVENMVKEMSMESRPSNDDTEEDEEEEEEDEEEEGEEEEEEEEDFPKDRIEIRNDSNNCNGRNVSIIVEELRRELARPYMENWKPWPDLESPDCESTETNSRGKTTSSTKDSTLPNPLSDLTEEDKILARRLSDMGFSLSRAARAVRDLGGKDNKRVVEYLLAVQYLEELGIRGDEAEKALVLMEYDQEKAKLYHENLCTLKGLGFTEEQASKALIKCDIDPDRALDFLVA